MYRAGRQAPLWRQRLAAGVIAGLVVVSANSGVAFAQDEFEEQAIEAAASDAGALGILNALDQAEADQEAAALAAAEEAAAQEAAAQAAAAEQAAPAPAEGEAAPVEGDIVAEQPVAAEQAAPAAEPVAEAPAEGAMALAEAAAAPGFAEQAAAAALPEGLDAAAILGVEAAPVATAPEAASAPAGDAAAAGNGGEAAAGGNAGTVRNAQTVEAAQPAANERGGVVGLRNRLVGVETEPSGGLEVGNGGTASSSADGGYVLIDDITTGGNSGNTINVYDCGYGSAAIDGGSVVNETTFDISAGGGNSISVGPGGDANFTGTAPRDGVTGGVIRNGNGGIASGGADGGWIVINTLDAGGNTGNTINNECGGGTGNAGDGTLTIDGGTVSNINHFTISADGGTAIADVTGGDENIGFLGGEAVEEGGRQRGVVGLRNELLGIGGGPVGGVLSVGNGGTARATADGGFVLIGDINTGGNTGNTINVGTPQESIAGRAAGGGGGGTAKPVSGNGCQTTDLSIGGGNVTNTNEFTISADGGTAIADGSGGDGNAGFGSGTGILALGNGGSADADANGGFVQIDDINTGGNSGNTISVEGLGCAQLAPVAPEKPAKPIKEAKPAKPVASAPGAKPGAAKPSVAKPGAAKPAAARGGTRTVKAAQAPARAGRGGAARAVRSLPSTGTGPASDGLVFAGGTTSLALLAACVLPLLALACSRRLAVVRRGR